MHIILKKTGPRSTDLTLKSLTPGQLMALDNALKSYGSPVALQLRDELQDAAAAAELGKD